MSFSAAEIRAIATLDASAFKKGIAEINESLSKFGSGQIEEVGHMIGGAFAVGAVVEFGKKLMEEAAHAERFASTIGMSASMLEELGQEASKTGASAEGFQQKIVKMLESQEKAAAGNTELARAFSNLGISMSDLISKTPEQLLVAVAEGAKTDATAIKDLNAVMGKGAAGEYGKALRDIAENGLPKVSKEAENAIHKFAQLDAVYTGFFAKVKQLSMQGGVAGWNVLKKEAEALLNSNPMLKLGFKAAGKEIDFLKSSNMGDKMLGLASDDDPNEAASYRDKRHFNEQKESALAQDRNEAVGKVNEKKARAMSALSLRYNEDIEGIQGSSRSASGMAGYGRMVGGSYQNTGNVAEQMLKEQEIGSKTMAQMLKVLEESDKALKALDGK